MNSGAGIIIFDKSERVFLNLRDNNTKYYPLHWAPIGGSVDEGEDPMTAAIRELEEETGYKTSHLNFLESKVRPHPVVGQHLAYIYWCIYDGVQELKCLEGLESKFIPIDEAMNLQLTPYLRELLPKAIEAYRAQR